MQAEVGSLNQSVHSLSFSFSLSLSLVSGQFGFVEDDRRKGRIDKMGM